MKRGEEEEGSSGLVPKRTRSMGSVVGACSHMGKLLKPVCWLSLKTENDAEEECGVKAACAPPFKNFTFTPSGSNDFKMLRTNKK